VLLDFHPIFLQCDSEKRPWQASFLVLVPQIKKPLAVSTSKLAEIAANTVLERAFCEIFDVLKVASKLSHFSRYCCKKYTIFS
jgi:hypothetical protein